VSRRIALTFVALIAALLVLAVVPLGVARTANERQSFRFDSISAARLVADAAEEYLADHRPATAMNVALTAAAAHGGSCGLTGTSVSAGSRLPLAPLDLHRHPASA